MFARYDASPTKVLGVSYTRLDSTSVVKIEQVMQVQERSASGAGKPRNPKRRGTILIADTPEGIETLKRSLAGDDVAFVTGTTLEEAQRHLRRGLRLILCGIHFDRGRMFDFLRLAKASLETGKVPFVCVRASGLLAKPLTPRGIDLASRELGAAAYVDHAHLENTVGIEKAAERLREALKMACSANK